MASLHWFGLSEVGSFALLYAILTLIIIVVRSLALEPLVVQFQGSARSAAPATLGASAIVSVPTAIALALSALTLDSMWLMLGAAAAMIPFLLQHDAYRYVLLADGRQMAAAANDGTALIVTGLSVALIWHSSWREPWALLLCWGAGAAAALVLGSVQTRSVASWSQGMQWLRGQRQLGVPLAGAQLAQQGTGRASQALISTIGGAAALGMVSASRTVITPLTTLITASNSYALPEGARGYRRRGRRGLDSVVFATSGVLAAVVVVYCAILLMLPARAGEVLAGRNWPIARELIVPTGLWVLGTAASQGPRIGLRVLERGRETLRSSLVMGLMLLLGTTAGVLVEGGVGAAWGFGLVSVFGQLVWWTSFHAARKSVSETEA